MLYAEEFASTRATSGCRPSGVFVAQPRDQCSQARAVFLGHRRELKAHSVSGLYVAHRRVGPDLSLLDEEINLGCCAYGPGRGCLDK